MTDTSDIDALMALIDAAPAKGSNIIQFPAERSVRARKRALLAGAATAPDMVPTTPPVKAPEPIRLMTGGTALKTVVRHTSIDDDGTETKANIWLYQRHEFHDLDIMDEAGIPYWDETYTNEDEVQEGDEIVAEVWTLGLGKEWNTPKVQALTHTIMRGWVAEYDERLGELYDPALAMEALDWVMEDIGGDRWVDCGHEWDITRNLDSLSPKHLELDRDADNREQSALSEAMFALESYLLGTRFHDLFLKGYFAIPEERAEEAARQRKEEEKRQRREAKKAETAAKRKATRATKKTAA